MKKSFILRTVLMSLFLLTNFISAQSVISDVQCSNNGTFNTAADDFVAFKLNPQPPGGIVVHPFKYNISATYLGNPVTITDMAGVAVTQGNYGEKPYYRINNGTIAAAGNIVITLTAQFGAMTQEVVNLTNPGTCSTVCTGASTGNKVTYYYENVLLLDQSPQNATLPKFDEGTSRTLTGVKIDYGFTASGSVYGENREPNPQTLRIKTEIEPYKFDINTVAHPIASKIIVQTPGYPTSIPVVGAVLVPASGAWPGDDPGVAPNFLASTLTAMGDYADTWLKSALASGIDPTTNPLWVTQLTGNAGDDDDITVVGNPTFAFNAPSINLTAPLDLNAYKGASTFPIAVEATGSLTASGRGGRFLMGQATKARYFVKVEYTYDCIAPPAIDAIDGSQTVSSGTTGTSVLANDTIENGAAGSVTLGATGNATISQTSTTNAGVNIDTATGNVVVSPGTPAGTYTITYEICTKATPVTCDTATETVTVPNLLDAVNDNYGPVTAGATIIISVIANDKNIAGTAAVIGSGAGQVSITTSTDAAGTAGAWPTGLTLKPDGTISVATGTAAGTYTLYYTICNQTAGSPCDTATVTLTVIPAVQADDDAFAATATQGISGATLGNVLTNDNYKSVADGSATTSYVNISVTTPATPVYAGAPVPSINTATGAVTLPPNTPAGSYTITYQICDKSGSPCDPATVTVTVAAPTIDAVNGTQSVSAGTTGTTSVLANDTYNGGAAGSATLANVNLTQTAPTTGVTLNTTTGMITVAAGTPAGTYEVTYQICDKINPGVCDTATETVTVTVLTPCDTVDTFATDQTAFTNTLASDYSSITGATILGGERDIAIINKIGSLPYRFGGSVAFNLLDVTQGSGEKSLIIVQWDGVDNDAATLNPTGLGGINLGGITKITIPVVNKDAAPSGTSLPVTLELWSNAGNASSLTITAPSNVINVNMDFILSSFTPLVGAGVDLTNIGAIVLKLDSTPATTASGLDFGIGSIAYYGNCLGVVDSIDAVLDINQTPINVPVSGNVITNDEFTGTATVTSAQFYNASGVLTNLPIGTATPVFTPAGVPAGTMLLNANGTYTYTPATGFVGEIPVNYTLTNNLGSTDSTTLTIKVIPNTVVGNDNPIAQHDTSFTEEGVSVSSTVLNNDSDPDGDALTVTSATGLTIGTATVVSGVNAAGTPVANAGTVQLNANGTYTYVPAAGFVGTVNPLPYVISDGNGGTATANIYITVVGAGSTTNNTFANDDANSAPKGVTMTGNVKTNDTDPEGNTTTVTAATVFSVNGVANGTALTIGTATVIPGVGSVTLNANGTYSFVPVATYVGTVVIPYTICDNGVPQACDQATLELTSLDVVDSIDAVLDISQTPVNVPVSGNVITNDEFTGTATVTSAQFYNASGVLTNLPIGTATPVFTPAGVPAGTMLLNANGTYTYTPATGFVGEIPVNYTLTNNLGSTDSTTLTIKVIPNTVVGNDNPIAQHDTSFTEEGVSVSSTVLNNDSDPDGDALTVTSATGLTIGTATVVSGVNAAGTPVANAGTVQLNANGTYTYVPAAGFVGTVNPLPYVISDGNGGTATANIYITVVGAGSTTNNTFANDDANSAPKGVTMTGNVKTNDTDPEGNTTTVTAATVFSVNGVANGTALTIGTATVIPGVGSVTLNANGTYSFVPVATYVGTVVIPYTICDNGVPQACDQATLELTSLDVVDSIDAVLDINQTPINVPVSGNVITNDEFTGTATVTSAQFYNASGVLTNLPIGTATPVFTPAGVPAGTMLLNANGTYTYTPATGFVGEIPVNYTLTNNLGSTDSTTLTIKVIPNTVVGNDNPIAQHDTSFTEEGVSVSSTVLNNDSDPDGDALTVTSATGLTIGTATVVSGVNAAGTPVANAGTVQLNANGTYTYVPAAGFVGTVNPLPYVISDGNGGTATANIYITVVGAGSTTNNTFANDDANSAPKGVTMTGNVKTNDTDPEGNTSAVTAASASFGGTTTAITIGSATNIPGVGALTLNSDGTYSFVPNATFVGTVVVPYTICDNGTPQACDQATLYLTSLDALAGYCYKLPVTSVTAVPSNHGITALGRAGADNSNWPMVRQSAWTVLEAKTKGFVVNRLTDAQVSAIPSADLREGMMVYNITQDCLQINIDGTATGWRCFNTQTCPD